MNKTQTLAAAVGVAIVIGGGLYFQQNAQTGEPVLNEPIETAAITVIKIPVQTVPVDDVPSEVTANEDMAAGTNTIEHAIDNDSSPSIGD